MPLNGRNLTRSVPSFGNKQLVSQEQQKAIRETNIAFSFEYYRQIDNFGVGNCSQSWHIGLIDRLSALTKMTPKQVLEENRGNEALRCHEIDWTIKNIPISRINLDWLPKEILDNEDSFPIMQFAITISTGRIVGFFDNDSSIFHVVLLDPNHNIQPTKKFNYQIRPTTVGVSQYDDLLSKLDSVKDIANKCKLSPCLLNKHINHISSLHENIVYIGLDSDFYEQYTETLKKHSLSEIIETGICELISK